VPKLVLSPDAFVRFRNGELIIHNAHSARPALASRDPGLIALMMRFATVTESDTVCAQLPPPVRPVAEALIKRLVEMNVLVDAATPVERPSAEEVELAIRQLGFVADATHLLASDLKALGPAAAGFVAGRTGVSLESRLTSLLAALDSLMQSLALPTRELLAAQLQKAGVDASSHGLKLHLGSGGHELTDWINVDVHPADVTVNLAERLPFPDGCARYIYAAHMLEHLYYPRQTLAFLAECHRVLESHGVLRIVVPDIEQCIRAYAAGDREFFNARHRHWDAWPQGTPLESFLTYAGAGPSPSGFLESHKFGFDFETLAGALKTAGFASVTRSSFNASLHADLRIDSASESAGAEHDTGHFSLFVETTKAAQNE